MPKFNPPEQFNFCKPTEWPQWKRRFTRYRVSTKLNAEEGAVQVSSLIYAMGNEAENIFSSFTFAAEESDEDYDTVLQKFEAHFIPKLNHIHERAVFNSSKQQNGESTETFIRNLYEMAERCNFGPEQKKENIRDRLVVGILDKDLSERLQLEEADLDTATQMVRQSELIKGQVKIQENGTTNGATNSSSVEEVNRRRLQHKRPPSNSEKFNKNIPSSSGHQVCNNCGTRHENNRCPARGRRCHGCNRYNHFRKCCRSSSGKHFGEVISDTEEIHQTFFLGSICNSECDSTKKWTIPLEIGNTLVTFKIDTGADTTIISEQCYSALNAKPRLEVSKARLYSPGGQLVSIGQFQTTVRYKGQNFTFPIYVIQGNVSNLLGRNVIESMGLVKRIDEINTKIFNTGGLINCEPVKIVLRDDAVPFNLPTARRVSFPLLPKVEAELNRMQSENIIERITVPTEWCSPMVPVIKKSGQVRICVDLKKLNQSVKREKYILPNLEDVAPKLVGCTVFSALDAAHGFYQLPLEEESSVLTTFITPLGRFRFKRLPFGITSAPEIFQRKMTEILGDQIGAAVCMDDIIIYGKDNEEHDIRLNQVFEKLSQAGVRLNREKCQIRKSEITYFGHIINSSGVSANPNKVKAISELSPPTDVTELRRLLGSINYLGRFLDNLSEIISPMTELLKSDVVWFWGPQQQAALEKVKEMLTSTPALAFYDSNKPTVVSADASSYGIGGALFQRQNDGALKPVAFCSRTLTSAERNYAQIEKECLASVWTCERFQRYLIGLDHFKLITDHKPLIPLMNSSDLNQTPIRCQRLLLRLRRFNAVAEYVPGKELIVPDMLSRSPLSTEEVTSPLEEEVELLVNFVESSMASDRKLQQIREETSNDFILQTFVKLTQNGWPDNSQNVPEKVRKYFPSRNELSLDKGLLLFRDRIVIPSSLRKEILDTIHGGHLGITKCLERARTTVWWPGISIEIKSLISSCDFCQIHQPSQRHEPLKPTPLPELPWSKLGTDILEINHRHYIVVIDYYSRYIELAALNNLQSSTVIDKLKGIFARWGVPKILVSDNATQYTSTMFQEFAKQYNFKSVFTSPHNPQANGESEIAVKIAKKVLNQSDPLLALMAYRSTPVSSTGRSPAQLLMGRQMRTPVPVTDKLLKPKWPTHSKVKKTDENYKSKAKFYFNRHHGVLTLPKVTPGDHVRVKLDGEKRWSNKRSLILNNDSTRRSCNISTSGVRYRRNRRHVMKVPSPSTKSKPVQSPEFKTPSPQKNDVKPDSSLGKITNPVNHQTNVSSPPTVPNIARGRSVRRPVRRPLKFNDYV